MKKQKSIGLALFTAFILFCLQTAAFGQENKLANLNSNGSNVRWDVGAPNSGSTLVVSAPDGRIFRAEFPAGTSPDFQITDKHGERLPNGQYTYELSLTPVLSPAAKEMLRAARGKDDEPEAERAARKRAVTPPLVQSGAFSILNGIVIVAGGIEDPRRIVKTAEPRSPRVIPARATTRLLHHRLAMGAMFDEVIADDLIVQSSLCVGFDCVTGEAFGADTVRLKENYLRIHFDDTSVSPYPANDWRIVANDTASGGSSYLAFEDASSGKNVFQVDAGAPTNALRVTSSGKIGLRTSTPVLDLQITTGDTPAHRFEQTSSSGYTAQTWDVAGNEANFFIRDVTSGSRLPFRIRPGAPTSSIDIAADGNVGIGTSSPASILTVQTTGGDTAGEKYLRVKNTNSFTGIAIDGGQSGDVDWLLLGGYPSAGDFTVRESGVGNYMTIKKTTGRVGIGTAAPDQLLSVNGEASKVGGGSWVAFSDERLKNIKGGFNSGLKAVMQLQPLRYEYKRDNVLGLKSEGEHIGFGAQALQKVIPEAVTKNAAGYLMVNNDPIIWTMLNAIKEQQKEIAELKSEVRKLRAASYRRRK